MKQQSGMRIAECLIGILLIVLGVICMLKYDTALTWLVVLCGIAAVLCGVRDIILYVRVERFTGFGPAIALIAGILCVLAGISIAVYPTAGKWILTLLIPIWIFAHCISRLSRLGFLRPIVSSGYYWFTLIANLIGLLLGGLMVFRPWIALLSVSWMIGIFLILIGIEWMLSGLMGPED